MYGCCCIVLVHYRDASCCDCIRACKERPPATASFKDELDQNAAYGLS